MRSPFRTRYAESSEAFHSLISDRRAADIGARRRSIHPAAAARSAYASRAWRANADGPEGSGMNGDATVSPSRTAAKTTVATRPALNFGRVRRRYNAPPAQRTAELGDDRPPG